SQICELRAVAAKAQQVRPARVGDDDGAVRRHTHGDRARDETRGGRLRSGGERTLPAERAIEHVDDVRTAIGDVDRARVDGDADWLGHRAARCAGDGLAPRICAAEHDHDREIDEPYDLYA